MRPISPASLRFFFSCARAASCLCNDDSCASLAVRLERWWRSELAGNQAKRTTAEMTTDPSSIRRARAAGPADASRRTGPSRPAARLPPAMPGAPLAREGGAPWEAGRFAQILLDAEQLVVLGHAVRTGRRAGLDLPRVHRHDQVGDGRVLGLARTV